MADTLIAPVRHALEVKHSRFLAQASPVTDGEAALAYVHAVSDPQATHNCWAWRCGNQYRSSDDGEPAGTAGRPILAAIDGQGFDQVVVVVTRWFGGIKLGAGGLVRAYGGSAAECLRQAPRKAILAQAFVHLTCPFDEIGTVHTLLAAGGATKLDERYLADGVQLQLQLPADAAGALKARLRDATRNRIRFLDADSEQTT